MTVLERTARTTIAEVILREVGMTELNTVSWAKDHGDCIEIELENGSKKIVSIIVTDSDE